MCITTPCGQSTFPTHPIILDLIVRITFVTYEASFVLDFHPPDILTVVEHFLNILFSNVFNVSCSSRMRTTFGNRTKIIPSVFLLRIH